MGCLDENKLSAYLSGGLTAAEVAEIETHLDGCAACRHLMAVAARAIGSTLPRIDDSYGDDDTLSRGTMVGRYVLLDRLGRGGMGVVWSAYDPELERKVAVKLMRPDRSFEAAAEARARLLREAQALARVAHPNVIAIHDVGSVGEQIFIAMELVAGATLTGWLREPRSTTEILDVFYQAGRGLAAAHAVGLVHRDFKPSNVMVSDDGRVRVLDFGLARAAGAAELARADAATLDEEPSTLETLTQPGVLIGTPAYMAPEQRAGERTCARADQYAFCVALCEALTGARPSDKGHPALRSRRVSAWLHKVLQRGLERDRTARFSSMEDLLATWQLDPAARRRRWLAAGTMVATLALAGAAGRAALLARARTCTDPEARLAGVWDTGRRERVAARFRAAGLPYGEDALQGASQLLDRYASLWSAMHRDACEATRVRGEQSEELLDLRMDCLEDRRKELRAATDLFTEAGPDVIQRATAVAGALTPVAQCADRASLRAVTRSPRDPRSRTAVAAIGDKLAGARILEEAGEYARGLALATEAVVAARALDHAPLVAEALWIRGELEDDRGDDRSAEQTLTDAVMAAERGRDDRGAVRARTGLAVAVNGLGRREEALRWIELAAAGLGRLDDEPLLRAKVLNIRGRVLDAMGRWDEARAALEEALAIRERALGPLHRDVAVNLVNLGVVAHDQRRPEDALRYYERALEVLKVVLGPSHPDVALTLGNIGSTLVDLDRRDEGRGFLERALELELRSLGPRHRSVANAHYVLGHLLRVSGKLDEALAQETQALSVAERAYGAEHPWLGFPLAEIGELHLAGGAPERAIAPLRRALQLPPRKRKLKPEVRFPLGRALWLARRDRDEAARLLAEAMAAYDAALPAEAASIGEIAAWMRAHGVKEAR